MKSKRTQIAISLIEQAMAELQDFSTLDARGHLQMALDRLRKQENKRSVIRAEQEYREKAQQNSVVWQNALQEGIKKLIEAQKLPEEESPTKFTQ